MTVSTKKVALITGAATGIGRAIAIRLAQDGIAVAVNFMGNPQQADELVNEIKEAGGSAIRFQADVSSVAEITKLFNDVTTAFGGIDIVVANAGIAVMGIPIADVTEADFDRINAVNYKGTYFVLQQAAKHVRNGGRIIQISSTSSLYPAAGLGIYAPSKAAGKVVTEILAQELGHRQISVNSVFPGPTKTPLMEKEVSKEELERIGQAMTLGRMGEPEDIAGVVAFLASPAGAWVNGQQIIVNGGGRV
ncbi:MULTISPECIES: glucose 1-dehydrogenase [unclassified Arcicella]|uniref:glucose 1-dehydrogenase n=1 Tax=unclassified Arcicella TaxID=2644986 RepID=UPI00285E146F|nr:MULTISPECIES: glucose 1-dehydrogenase [unclassified Arcicella]MDR6564651.1 3-oxoacyl-[acyl-carrier protein] reductase [Arcicella sp. BE51]MDR6814421.1 3-oxoacyl-[acyl-carrier protein] reductase [Arcicella sp. BE140]MDR6825823.1 3-oxoacyl-[acyl-carrier protein] reductase [Arcicella sp. BE139]